MHVLSSLREFVHWIHFPHTVRLAKLSENGQEMSHLEAFFRINDDLIVHSTLNSWVRFEVVPKYLNHESSDLEHHDCSAWRTLRNWSDFGARDR